MTGIFVLLKNYPRIKIFRKFLSCGIKYFVLGHKFSENFCPTQIKFVLPHSHRTKIFRKVSENFCPTQIKFVLPHSHRTKIFRKVSENFCPRIKIFSKASENFYPILSYSYRIKFFIFLSYPDFFILGTKTKGQKLS